LIVRKPTTTTNVQTVPIFASPTEKLPEFVRKSRVLNSVRSSVNPPQKVAGNVHSIEKMSGVIELFDWDFNVHSIELAKENDE
jgi:hypothetical protein